ncbi:hypothetical protein AMATHDRAFT_5783 [Amanita thiersii Skay4041]|uniref:G-protein coupled receptors family 1 profile domain-containing protein n=1 Tax=Amanita thiersii Skay4041 TaxID=703135 RepID=A0A2A9NL82_9AGAR|nr:hypothetical protein AMATHDRAFT_5783 [Amanita thiersii Skay4041]
MHKITIIAMFVQSILYGPYLCTVLYCIRWLVFADQGWTIRQRIDRPMLAITLLLCLLSTADLGVSLVYTLTAQRDEIQLMYLLSTVTFILEGLEAILADGVLIYRCWVVGTRRWTMIFLPLTFWLANIGNLVTYTYWSLLITLNPSVSDMVIDRVDKLSAAFYSLTMATNIYATSAIIICIWSVAKETRSLFSEQPQNTQLQRATRVIAESGLLYTQTSIMLLITWFIPPPKGTLPLVLSTVFNSSATGFAFNLIIIRVARNRSINST